MKRKGSEVESSSKAEAKASPPAKTPRGSGVPWARVLETHLAACLREGRWLGKGSEAVVVADAYPKALRHALVCPLDGPSGLAALRPAHLPLLRHMAQLAASVADAWRAEGHSVAVGFHALPSLTPLHLHLVTKDFHSAALKTKRHWNSFNTAFFRPLEEVAAELEDRGAVDVEPKRWAHLLSEPIRCSHCRQPFPTMPKLKAHLASLLNDSSSTS